MLSLSVIIPTHKRPQRLEQCLRKLEKQTIAGQLEVIVVCDDEGETVAFHQPKNYRLNLQWLEIPPTHQGTARNRGTKIAQAPTILFIGDDILLEPHTCEQHVNFRNNYVPENPADQYAILGRVDWDPACGITEVMNWLTKTGWQFGFDQLKIYEPGFLPKRIQHRYTYTSQISLPADLARQFPFREDINLYGWEDVEWGMRLREAGVGLYFDSQLRSLHHHHLTLEDSLKRMETLGRSVVAISRLVPNLDRQPRGIKLLAYKIASLLPTMAGKHRRAFLKGLSYS